MQCSQNVTTSRNVHYWHIEESKMHFLLVVAIRARSLLEHPTLVENNYLESLCHSI